MKTFSTDFTSNIENPNGVRYIPRLRLFPNRVFFTDDDVNWDGAFGDSPGVHYGADDPIVQQVVGSDSSSNPLCIANIDGSLRIYRPGIEYYDELSSSVDATFRPGYFSGDETVYYLSSGTVYGQQTDGVALTGSPADTNIDISSGALYGVDYGTVVALHYDDGGISVSISISGTVYESPHRFMDPGELWDSGALGQKRLNFSTAVVSGWVIYIYLTMPSGHVEGLTFHIGNHQWGDYFTAVPNDLTGFYISGSYVDLMDHIHLVGQFVRTEEQETGVIYNLDIWSQDGFTFTIDRFSLFSTSGCRFGPCFPTSGSSGVVYNDANGVYTAARLWSSFGGSGNDNLPVLEIPATSIESLSGTPGDSYTVSISDGGAIYWNSPYLTIGTAVELDLSVDNGTIWERYDTCILAAKEIDHLKYKLALQLQNEAVWRISDLTYPMYVEIQGKQAVFNYVAQLDQLQELPESKGIAEPFCVSFLDSAGEMGGSVSPIEHYNNAPVTVLSDDIVSACSLNDYPEIPGFPLTVKIYGWSRTGPNDTNPNSAYTTPTTEPNDDFQPSFLINRDGTESTVVIPKNASTRCYPPETWDPTDARSPAGAIPVVYTITDSMGLAVGDKLVKMGVVVSGVDTNTPLYATVFWIERIEIPQVFMYGYDSTNLDEVWVSSDTGATSDTADFTYKRKGVPSILFSERPNFSFDFDARARYSVTGEQSYAGVFGLAENGRNLIGARFDTRMLEIFKIRNGVTTVLASYEMDSTPPDSYEMSIELVHRHGDFYVYTMAPDVLVRPATPALTYRWTAADGPLVTDAQIMHCGTYCFIDVPSFRIVGFNLADSDGIGVLPGAYTTSGSNPLALFPSSGKIDIDGTKYLYSGKTPVAKEPRGPFLLRNSGSWPSHTNPLDGISYGGGSACEFSYFDWTESRSAWNGYLMSVSNGANWLITDLEHRVYITTGGRVVRLRNRCRGYGASVNNNNSVSTSDQISLTYGLTGISLSEGEASFHPEGSMCFIDSSNEITLKNFIASSANHDTTVEDLLKKITMMAGAHATFPGNRTYSLDGIANLTEANLG